MGLVSKVYHTYALPQCGKKNWIFRSFNSVCTIVVIITTMIVDLSINDIRCSSNGFAGMLICVNVKQLFDILL